MRELLGGPEPGPEPVEIQPRLELVRIDPRGALADFLRGVLPIRALRERLLASHSFSILTAAAPGIEEFLTLAKIVELESMARGVSRRPRYDLVLVDAPATGHSLSLLATARTMMEMIPVGPIGKTATQVSRVLGDARRAAAVIVTIPEEMAINETVEIASGLARSGAIAVGPLIANAFWPERFTRDETRWLLSSGVDASDPMIAAGRYHVDKRRRAEEQVARLRAELRIEPVKLPFVVDEALDRPHLRRLVGALEQAYPLAATADA
jgi:anion-transporting  ArsA/GET3 family ATPase